MVARRMKGLGLERAEAIDEVIAYSCEMMLKNSKALTEFAKEHKRLFEKICDAVWDFIKKIRNALSELYGADTAFHEEARFMELYADELQEVFDRVLKKTLEISESTVNHDLQSNANKKAATEGGKVQFAKGEIYNVEDTNGNIYSRAVLLDYENFNKTKRHISKYIEFIHDKLVDKKITVLDENQNSEIIEFAKKNERIKKGEGHPRRVLGELERAKDSLKKLAISNLVEIINASVFSEKRSPDGHQWLDAKGWEIRTSYVVSNENIIYPVQLFIGKAKDGRILYTT